MPRPKESVFLQINRTTSSKALRWKYIYHAQGTEEKSQSARSQEDVDRLGSSQRERGGPDQIDFGSLKGY